MISPAAHASRLQTVLGGRLRSGVWPTFVAMSGAVLIYCALLIANAPVADSTLVGGWGVDVFELLASVLCIAAGWRSRSRSAVPLVLGAALLCWTVGDFVTTSESLGGATPPSPSLADAFYLAFFPLCYVALMLFVKREARHFSSPNWLDGAVAGLGAAAVCAAFAFETIVHSTGQSGLGVAVNLAYPVGDVLLLLLVAGGSVVMSGRRREPWLLLSAGIAANVLGDTSNLFSSSIGGSHVGTVLNAVAWPASTMLLAMAMWLRSGTPDPLAPPKGTGFLLPGLAAGAGLGVLFARTIAPVNRIATGLAGATLLLVVLRTWLSVRQLRTQSQERQHQSVTDHLTGLANRRRLFEALDAVFGEADADRLPVAFLFIDLNGFKQVNDAFGHPVGDEVLRRVAERLAGALRGSDLLARVGGDEFAVLLAGADAERATAAAQHLSASLDKPFQIDAVSAQIGASIGVALAPSDSDDSAGLVWCADVAMYRAKLAGSRFAAYEHTTDGGRDRLRLADELSLAIDSHALVLHYQPQLDLDDRRVTTVEALVRWHHPSLSLIGPMTFLPLAEEAGLMGKVTRWVLAEALTQCASWRAAGTPVRVSVNVSASDLLDSGFPDLVAELLAAKRLPAGSLLIEITETSIIEEFERASAVVARLRDLGVQVSIDDFGAGFTSLAYLNSLAVGQLKLDRRFIAPLAGGIRSRDSDLVRATIELGHALGLQVVAEGVEDFGALELLAELGCDVAQGFGVGSPVPAAELALAGLVHSRLPPGGTTHSLRANSSASAASSSRTWSSPASLIVRASSDQPRATPATRAVGPQPAAAVSSAARARTSASVNSPNGL